MKAVVFNHATTCIRVLELPDVVLNEQIEEQLINRGVHLSECSWMCSYKGEDIPVFYENEDEPRLSI
jgi:hypothetical protein